MQVMILHEDKVLRGVLAATLRSKGFGVQGFASPDAARDAARRSAPDLLVMAERVGDRLAHDLALLAEWRNPALCTLLLSTREGEERDEIFELLPSLREVHPPSIDARSLLRRILTLARTQEGGAALMNLRWRTLAEAEAEADPPASALEPSDPRLPASNPATLDHPAPGPSPQPAAAAHLAWPSPSAQPSGGPARDHAPPLRTAPDRRPADRFDPDPGRPILLSAVAALRARPAPPPPDRPEAAGAVFLRAAALRPRAPARRLHLA